MNENPVEQFFDSVASSWDERECHSRQEKLRLLCACNLNIGDKVIDIACGTGVITSLIHELTESDVLGVDISKNMIDIAKEKYKELKYASFKHIDVMDLDEDNKFDYAIIYNAYPHFSQPRKLSSKLSKILNPNGHFAILHSLSRQELSLHHQGKASNVSRDLDEIVKEAKYFENEFIIEKAYEDDHSIILIGKLK